jgi:hypothetical protein
MKKIFLTVIAVGFSFSHVFAQATGTEATQQEQQDTRLQQEEPHEVIVYERERVRREDDAERKRVGMDALPDAVQEAFRESEYSDWQVLAIFELEGEAAAIEVEEDRETIYAIELIEDIEEATQPGAVVRRPDMVLHFDEEGEKLKATDPEKVMKGIRK